jgi:hypothetical protein
MPEARLPSTPLGWVVGFFASLVGLLAGMLTIRILGGILG